MLLIHAGVTDRRSWRPLLGRLRDRHRCVAYDMRGYGETEYEPEPGWSAPADALAVLDAAGIERAVVVACSMGGEIALELALAAPERVRALVLIGTAVFGAPYPELSEGPTFELGTLAEAAYEAGDLDEVCRLDARMWLDGPAAPEGRVGGAARELFMEMNGKALRAPEPGEQAGREPAWPHLDELELPTLMLLGSLDAEDIQLVDRLAAERIPAARLVVLEGVAHLPHLEGDERTLDEIEGFLEGPAQTPIELPTGGQ